MKVFGSTMAPVRPTFKATASKTIWSPGHISDQEETEKNPIEIVESCDINPIWQPFGGPVETSHFRTVKIETMQTKETESETLESQDKFPSDRTIKVNHKDAEEANENLFQDPDVLSQIPVVPVSLTEVPARKSGICTSLPPSQCPTVTLLQKAREGQFSRGAVYIDENKAFNVPADEHCDMKSNDVISANHEKSLKYDGIGPTEHGIPIGLRTSVKDEYASDWYRTMYRSLHRQSLKKGQSVNYDGYMSEPEFSRNSTGLRTAKYSGSNLLRKPINQTGQEVKYLAIKSNIPESDFNPFLPSSNHSFCDTYKNQPRSIADYEPGHSSIADKEFQKFWADFWDSMGDLKQHFGDGGDLKQNQSVGRRWFNYDGYDSDSTIIRKTGETHQLDPMLQKAFYKEVQKGGEIPFTGLGKPAPEKPKISSHQYQETEVNIHYRSPIRNLEKEYIEEEELRRRQEAAMKKFYEEEKYKKNLQQQAEVQMRRHCDFFTPAQKSPIPLNRYDTPFTIGRSSINKTPEPRTIARALFTFSAHTTRELSFNKGDMIYINKKIDKNWYEGEHHGQIGIFPGNYVEIIPFEDANLQPRKATEGQAVVKFNFRAQTPMELSLFKTFRKNFFLCCVVNIAR